MVKGCTLLKPGMGKQGNTLLPALEGLEQGQTATWMWPGEIKAPTCTGWLLLPLGGKWGEKLANSALGDWDMAPYLKGDRHILGQKTTKCLFVAPL